MSWQLLGKVLYLNPIHHKHWEVMRGDDYKFQVYGEAVDNVIEDSEGRMWVTCDDEPQATQVNFNPFTGEPAKVPREDKI